MVLGATVPSLVQLGQNFATGELPAGCVFCRDGAKMVLYLTGDCQSHCWYCPVDRDRMYVDRAFANEQEIASEDTAAAIEEARAMRAVGMGITGGDPMVRPERVVRFCRALKAEFGPQFHIHMYTQNPFDAAWLPKLEAAGLDEIRFHPAPSWWDKMQRSPFAGLIAAARKTTMRVGAEVPAIPHRVEQLHELVDFLDSAQCEFLNLNELEFSQANVDQLVSRGLGFQDDETNTVAGSRETALLVARGAVERGRKMVVHFCASSYKDDVQLRNRFLRRAQNTERDLEAVTPEGTILHGVVEGADPEAVHRRLTEQLGVPLNLVQIDRKRNRVDVAGWVLEDVFPDVEGSCFIVEVHPSATRLEVERTPLPYPEDDDYA